MHTNRVRLFSISLILLPTTILIGDFGCRKQPPSSSRATPSARKRAQPPAERTTRKSSRSHEKATPKTPTEPPINSGRKRPTKGDRDKKEPARKEREPREWSALKGIEFTFKPDWPALDARLYGDIYVLGYALADRRSGKFAPRLVVRNVPDRHGKTEKLIKRWVSEFASGGEGPQQPTVEVAEMTVQNLNIKLADITGVYQPDQKHPSKQNFRFLCAIIDHEDGLAVLKAMGPFATIEKHYERIMELIKSVRPTVETKSPTNT